MRTISALPQDGILTWHEETGLVSALIPPGPFTSAHAPALFETKHGDILCGLGFAVRLQCQCQRMEASPGPLPV